MRTKFSVDEKGRVTVEYDRYSLDGVTRESRTFSCSEDGGYVWELTFGGRFQVCDRLAGRGSTLYCSSRDRLIDVIRREYRAMRRANI